MLFLLSLLSLLQVTLHAAASDRQLALADFDQAVLIARQHMRQFCALVQEVMKQEDSATAQKALAEINK